MNIRSHQQLQTSSRIPGVVPSQQSAQQQQQPIQQNQRIVGASQTRPINSNVTAVNRPYIQTQQGYHPIQQKDSMLSAFFNNPIQQGKLIPNAGVQPQFSAIKSPVFSGQQFGTSNEYARQDRFAPFTVPYQNLHPSTVINPTGTVVPATTTTQAVIPNSPQGLQITTNMVSGFVPISGVQSKGEGTQLLGVSSGNRSLHQSQTSGNGAREAVVTSNNNATQNQRQQTQQQLLGTTDKQNQAFVAQQAVNSSQSMLTPTKRAESQQTRVLSSQKEHKFGFLKNDTISFEPISSQMNSPVSLNKEQYPEKERNLSIKTSDFAPKNQMQKAGGDVIKEENSPYSKLKHEQTSQRQRSLTDSANQVEYEYKAGKKEQVQQVHPQVIVGQVTKSQEVESLQGLLNSSAIQRERIWSPSTRDKQKEKIHYDGLSDEYGKNGLVNSSQKRVVRQTGLSTLLPASHVSLSELGEYNQLLDRMLNNKYPNQAKLSK